MTDTEHWNQVIRADAMKGQSVILWGKYRGKVEGTSGARVRIRWDHPQDRWPRFTWCQIDEVEPLNS
jgi:hypothetical protein